jgi:hypothetical protein
VATSPASTPSSHSTRNAGLAGAPGARRTQLPPRLHRATPEGGRHPPGDGGHSRPLPGRPPQRTPTRLDPLQAPGLHTSRGPRTQGGTYGRPARWLVELAVLRPVDRPGPDGRPDGKPCPACVDRSRRGCDCWSPLPVLRPVRRARARIRPAHAGLRRARLTPGAPVDEPGRCEREERTHRTAQRTRLTRRRCG